MDNKTPVYNMKSVIKKTSPTPATLRARERRYSLFKPQRSPGGHRLYCQDDVALLKWLVEKQKQGLSISRAVDLWRSQTAQPQESAPNASVSLVPPATGEGKVNTMIWLCSRRLLSCAGRDGK